MQAGFPLTGIHHLDCQLRLGGAAQNVGSQKPWLGRAFATWRLRVLTKRARALKAALMFTVNLFHSRPLPLPCRVGVPGPAKWSPAWRRWRARHEPALTTNSLANDGGVHYGAEYDVA